jgi:sortase A
VTTAPGKLRRNLRRLQHVFFICGALALGYSAFVLISARLYQKKAAKQFEQHVYVNTPVEPSPSVARPADGAPLARFEIPRLNMDMVVIEGDTDADLRRAIGHIPGTALPGNTGNVGIAGHRDTFFRPLRNVRAGDVITLKTTGVTYRYKVESTEVVMPDRSDVLNPTPEPHLTLVTCFPFYYVGSAPKRFIVHAREIEPTTPASPGKEGNLAPATATFGN